MCWVIDADITAYFDTIPHDRLMKTVAQRVVDGAMLALVKRFLEAPIIDTRMEDGHTAPGKGRRKAASSLRCWRTSTCTCSTGTSAAGWRGETAGATRPLCG